MNFTIHVYVYTLNFWRSKHDHIWRISWNEAICCQYLISLRNYVNMIWYIRKHNLANWQNKKKKKPNEGHYQIFWTSTSISLFFIMQIFIVLSFFICFENMTAMLIPNEVRLFTVFNLFLFVTSHSLTIKKLYKKYLQARKTHTCIYYDKQHLKMQFHKKKRKKGFCTCSCSCSENCNLN